MQKKIRFFINILALFTGFNLFAQTTVIKGIVKNPQQKGIAGVNIQAGEKGTSTNEKGQFSIKLKKSEKVRLVFSHINYQTKTINIVPELKEEQFLIIILQPKQEKFKEVIIKAKGIKEKEGAVKIGIVNAKVNPGVQKSVENVIKSLPSASGFDELSSQYMVRGGNFDENQVYINGIEIYRPFLIRSGQQEGLSFINPDLVQNIYFYPGGFAADKGDKLSSVLDVTYKNPTSNETSFDLNLLGGSISHEFRKNKIGNITGIRYYDNSLLVNSKDVEVDYRPQFLDFQNLFRYDFNKKLYTEFYTNISINHYRYQPQVKTTNFGSLQDAKVLVIDYDGQEKDNYLTYFGALKTRWKASNKNIYTFTTSLYHTQEEEYFDLLGQYNIGEPNTDLGSPDFGNPENLESLGSELNHARNDLDALIGNMEIKYKKIINPELQLESGIKISYEDIKDRINEWQMIDSAGFALYPPGSFHTEEPYDLDTAPILPYQNTKSFNHVNIQRAIPYLLMRKKFSINKTNLWINAGIRSQFWKIDDRLTRQKHADYAISPHLLIGLKPHWKKNMEFRLATGIYQQAPFYKEFRNASGQLNINILAQKSYIISLANDWFFSLWERPFKLTSEIYYKYLWDVNPYTMENVRIRYFANNNATAYAYGFETRINGEFIPGAESWFSLALMKSMENTDNRGYIPRPSDQRFKFAMLFQDYVPKIPNLKMYLNMTYMGGIPTGSPSYADPYLYQFRTKNYFRSDIGIFFVFSEMKNKPVWMKKFKYFSAGIEILNMFEVRNSITNLWIRDIYRKKVYRVPNYLTGRVFNYKLILKL